MYSSERLQIRTYYSKILHSNKVRQVRSFMKATPTLETSPSDKCLRNAVPLILCPRLKRHARICLGLMHGALHEVPIAKGIKLNTVLFFLFIFERMGFLLVTLACWGSRSDGKSSPPPLFPMPGTIAGALFLLHTAQRPMGTTVSYWCHCAL